MSDVKNTHETNAEAATEDLKVKLNTEAETGRTQANANGKRGACGDWAKHAAWQGKSRKKLVLAAVLIALFGFMLGKVTSHNHHQWHGAAHQQQMYEGDASRLPMSMLLDGIEATPAQRAKAVELMR